jgi:hypothetical protein
MTKTRVMVKKEEEEAKFKFLPSLARLNAFISLLDYLATFTSYAPPAGSNQKPLSVYADGYAEGIEASNSKEGPCSQAIAVEDNTWREYTHKIGPSRNKRAEGQLRRRQAIGYVCIPVHMYCLTLALPSSYVVV